MQPLALGAGDAGCGQLRHFVAAGAWDAEPPEAALPAEADQPAGGGGDALPIADDTLPKKGRHLVAVAPQYATVPGKNAGCQTLVSLTLARRAVPVVVGLGLFLPESWTRNPERPDPGPPLRRWTASVLRGLLRLRSGGLGP